MSGCKVQHWALDLAELNCTSSTPPIQLSLQPHLLPALPHHRVPPPQMFFTVHQCALVISQYAKLRIALSGVLKPLFFFVSFLCWSSYKTECFLLSSLPFWHFEKHVLMQFSRMLPYAHVHVNTSALQADKTRMVKWICCIEFWPLGHYNQTMKKCSMRWLIPSADKYWSQSLQKNPKGSAVSLAISQREEKNHLCFFFV